MAGKKRNSITSWIFVYALLVAAVVFTGQSAAVVPPESGTVSPVVLGGSAPLLTVTSITNRSDI